MAQVTITINSREYAVACDDGQEAHIIKLSRLIDEKAKMLTAGGGHINENMLLAMSALLLADDLNEAKNTAVSTTDVPTETKVIEKIVEVEKIIEKPVEVEKPVEIEKIVEVEKVVEKIVEVEKAVDGNINYEQLDDEISSVLETIVSQIKNIKEEINNI